MPNFEEAFEGQDAVICAVSAGGLPYEKDMVDAAFAVGVKRFVLDEYAFGPEHKGLPDLESFRTEKKHVLQHVKDLSERNPKFTWSALATGIFIDVVIRHVFSSSSLTSDWTVTPLTYGLLF